MNTVRVLSICGMLSPVLYTLLWILGGILVPGYSHIRNDVSSLYAIGAYGRWFFQPLFILCSSLLLIFYIGLHRGVSDGNGSIVGPILFIISSCLGVFVACFFPLDTGGEIGTWRGKMHLILIAASGVILLPAMVLMFFRLRFTEGWQGFAVYSLVSAPITLVLVIVTGISAGSKHMGLVERFMVSKYQLYYFITALMVFLRNQ